MLVVGDGCDERTGAILDTLADPRIAYVNLPARFGEQAGPNSIGMALADSERIALLNHDDVWLPDHLKRACAALDGGADLYIGRAARADEVRETDGGPVPSFTKRSPGRRRLRHAFNDSENLFEPCSAWAFQTELARAVGPWRLAREIYRTPAEDWLLRIWRHGARVSFDEAITVLHLITHYRRKRPDGCYEAASPEHDALAPLLAATPLSDLRAKIEAVARTRDRSGVAHAIRKPLRALFVNPLTADLFRVSGLDANSLFCRIAGKSRGHVLNRVTVKRTGRDLPVPPDPDDMLRAAREILAEVCA